MLVGIKDVSGWIAISGYHALEDNLNSYGRKKELKTVDAIISSLIDEPLERQIREIVYGASREDYEQIWKKIEEFKRDNPHLYRNHLWSSYWGHVGKWRFPFTYDIYCEQARKKHLTKSDEKMLATYRGWTITLLMNTHGRYSKMEATRVAYHQVYGQGAGDWTREFG